MLGENPWSEGESPKITRVKKFPKVGEDGDVLFLSFFGGCGKNEKIKFERH